MLLLQAAEAVAEEAVAAVAVVAVVAVVVVKIMAEAVIPKAPEEVAIIKEAILQKEIAAAREVAKALQSVLTVLSMSATSVRTTMQAS